MTTINSTPNCVNFMCNLPVWSSCSNSTAWLPQSVTVRLDFFAPHHLPGTWQQVAVAVRLATDPPRLLAAQDHVVFPPVALSCVMLMDVDVLWQLPAVRVNAAPQAGEVALPEVDAAIGDGADACVVH